MKWKKIDSRRYACFHCHMRYCAAVDLYIHIMSCDRLTHTCPELVPLYRNVNNFMDVFMRDDPILGLEHVEQGDQGDVTQYTCHLCTMDCMAETLISHIISIKHMENYMNRHYPTELDSCRRGATSASTLNPVVAVALNIQRLHGRKAMKTASSACDPSPAKAAKYTDPDQAGDAPISPDPASSTQGAAMEKLLDTLQEDMSEKFPFMHFKDNVDFMNYLRRFEIRNDEDAKYLSEITKNCAKAITKAENGPPLVQRRYTVMR